MLVPYFWCSLHTLTQFQSWFGLRWFGACLFGHISQKVQPLLFKRHCWQKDWRRTGLEKLCRVTGGHLLAAAVDVSVPGEEGWWMGLVSVIAAHPLHLTHSWLVFQGFSVTIIFCYSFKYLCGIAVNVIGNTEKCPPAGSQEEQVRAAQNCLFPSSYSPALCWAGWQRPMAVPNLQLWVSIGDGKQQAHLGLLSCYALPQATVLVSDVDA